MDVFLKCKNCPFTHGWCVHSWPFCNWSNCVMYLLLKWVMVAY